MQIIRPASVDIAASGAGSGYANEDWATLSGTVFAVGAQVRHDYAGGSMNDYLCLKAHTYSALYEPGARPIYWRSLGAADPVYNATYITNCKYSYYSAWLKSQELSAGTILLDTADRSDYYLNASLEAADNLIRPSQCVASSDPLIAARWSCRGYANAWAALDYATNSTWNNWATGGGFQVSPLPYFTVRPSAGAYIDHVAIDGLYYCTNIKLEFYSGIKGAGGTLLRTYNKSMVDSRGDLLRAAVIPLLVNGALVGISADANTLIYVTLTPANAGIPISLHYLCMGFGQSLGETEWDVESSLLSFSRRERDKTFGTMSFMQRGSAKVLSATAYIDPANRYGDTIQSILAINDATPCMYDFNNSDSNYDRLRVFGYWTKFRTLIKTASWESLQLQVEGLIT